MARNQFVSEFPEDDDDDCHSSSENASVSNSMIEVMLRHGVPEKQIFDEVAVMLAVVNCRIFHISHYKNY